MGRVLLYSHAALMPSTSFHKACLRCTPAGRLMFEAEGARTLRQHWAQSDAVAMLDLALADDPGEVTLQWAREWGRSFMARLCQLRSFDACAPPPGGVERQLSRLPEMLGAEYVNEDVLTRLWNQMLGDAKQRAGVDLESWLQQHTGPWQQVGRVMLHLAENVTNAERPFAFIATFADRISAGGKVQHLPLARALQRLQSSQDQALLSTLLQPIRAAADRTEIMARLLESKQLFQALAWTPAEAYELVREMSTLQDCGLAVKVPDWWKGGRPARPLVQVTVEPSAPSSVGAGAMLGFRLALCLNGEPLTPEELEKIKASPSGLVSLRGAWVELNHERLDQVKSHWEKVQRMHEDSGISFHQAMRYLSGYNGLHAAEQGGAALSQAPKWSEVVAGLQFQRWLEELQSPEPIPVPAGIGASLRPYQIHGYRWLYAMQKLGLGACLADDMGLGKTLQVIALLLKLKTQKAGPSLIICPASLLASWQAECRKFAPALQTRVLHRSALSKAEMEEIELDAERCSAGADVVITTYLMASKSKALQQTAWQLVVLDEAQAIKNAGTTQALAVKKIRAAGRVALTGTPIENRPSDLWSLFDFLNAGLLGTVASFTQALAASNASVGEHYAALRHLVAPYILRRMKTDRRIIADLPDKIEMTVGCTLTRKQAVLYTQLVAALQKTLNDESLDPMVRKGRILGFLQKFKQVCNHPSQFNGDGQYRSEDSGKFLRLGEICAELAQRQERVLIFTQFQEMCEPLATHLAQVFGRPGLVLHGGTPVAARAALVERFQAEDGPPFFVISVKAGGTGLTLTAASHVIHFDRWWNPAVENQATDRAFRIGQRKNVLVHKFVIPGTIEAKIDKMLQEKSQLASALLETGGESALALTELSSAELLQLVSLDLSAVL